MYYASIALFLVLHLHSKAQIGNALNEFVADLDYIHDTHSFKKGGLDPSWTPYRLYTPPGAESPVLGQFKSKDELRLKLDEIPPHDRLLICLELVIFCHWDGVWKSFGPDSWNASLHNGPLLIKTTFSNFSGAKQNFPDEVNGGIFPPQSASSSTGDLNFVEQLGENKGQWRNLDATYKLWLAVSHGDPSVTLVFSGDFHDDPDQVDDWGQAGENWGIKSCKVWAVPRERQLDPKVTAQAVSELFLDKDIVPDSASHAALVLSGPKTYPLIFSKLEKLGLYQLIPYSTAPSLKNSPEYISEIIEELTSENYSDREDASRKLATLLPQHRKLLQETAKTHSEPEVSLRLKMVLEEFDRELNEENQNDVSQEDLVKLRIERFLRLLSKHDIKAWHSSEK